MHKSIIGYASTADNFSATFPINLGVATSIPFERKFEQKIFSPQTFQKSPSSSSIKRQSIEKEKEAMKDLQLELEKDQANTKQHRSKYDNIANVKTNIELQLNFLINQLNHYLSQIKN